MCLALCCSYNAAVGTVFSSATSATAALIGGDGVVDTSSFYALTGNNLRGAATADGTYNYIGTNSGLKGGAYGANGAAITSFTSATSASMGALTMPNSTHVCAAFVSAPYGITCFPTGLAASTTLTAASGGLLGLQQSGSSIGAIAYDPVGQNWWTAQVGAVGTAGLLTKYALNATGGWSRTTGYPKTTVSFTPPGSQTATTASGLKSLAGRYEGGSYVLYAATTAATTGANYLLRFVSITTRRAVVFACK